MNRWNIPEWLENEVMKRDTRCVYCGVAFNINVQRHGSRPSWEHIVNDIRIITAENIVRCCISCNSSKGAKELTQWLNSSYCKGKNITSDTVALVVKRALE
jgi:hypothetical protein